jgi:hypothetical protein
MGLSGQLHTLLALTPVPTECKVAWTQKQIWKLRKKEKSLASAENRILARFIVNDHAILSNKGQNRMTGSQCMLCVCVCPFRYLNQMNEFYETYLYSFTVHVAITHIKKPTHALY